MQRLNVDDENHEHIRNAILSSGMLLEEDKSVCWNEYVVSWRSNYTGEYSSIIVSEDQLPKYIRFVQGEMLVVKSIDHFEVKKVQ